MYFRTFLSLTGSGFQTISGSPIPKFWSSTPWGGGYPQPSLSFKGFGSKNAPRAHFPQVRDKALQLYPGYQRFILACDEELSPGGCRHVPTGLRPKAEGTSGEASRKSFQAFRADDLLRLDRNKNPRVKSLWHPGYFH